MYFIVINKLFSLSPAIMISHPSIGCQGGNPVTGKDRYIWLVNYKELFYNFLPGLVP